MDVAAPSRADWRPQPFRQFVLKLHSRCNLACDYCYVYTMADQRWRLRPRVMSRRTMDLAAARVAEHVRAHALTTVDVTIHGGEPLLAGASEIAYCVSRMRAAVGGDAEVRVGVHTNGTLLDPEYLRLFDALGVRVSISLDGDVAAHDRHRRGPNGAGTHAAVSRALRDLGQDRYRPLFAGLLCTIDLRNEPVATYEALLEYAPPVVDFLLPHGNWSAPPPRRGPGLPETPYADWLIAVFERWYGAPCRETRVRLFEEIINVLLGGRSRVEGVGIGPAVVVVVEADGAIEQSDMLASAYEGAAATGLHVGRDSFDDALRLPAFAARQLGAAGLPSQCHTCDVRRVCGGGLHPHRYRADSGFDHPSVYCPDLYRLIGHIRSRLAGDLAALREKPS